MSSRELLELQSDRIEMVLANHKAPARVTGGIVTPRAIQYHLTPALGTKVGKMQALADELALTLGVTHVRMSRKDGSVQLEIPRHDAQPVKLLSIMSKLKSIPASTAILGLCNDGAPLLIRLSSPDVGHVLIAGRIGSGKTTLCQTIILSLAMTHRRSQLQIVLTSNLASLAGLPHIMPAMILHTLVSMLGREPEPRIIIVMDELSDVIKSPEDEDALGDILERGRESGIHVIATTCGPTKFIFPIRIVGKVGSPEDAQIASGIGDTDAEKLVGRGDFIAIASGQMIRFQSAYVNQAEIIQVVSQLGSKPMLWDMQGRPSMLHKAAQVLAC